MPDTLNNLTRLSTVMAWLATFGLVAWPAMTVAAFLWPGSTDSLMFGADNLGALLNASVPAAFRVAALAFSLGAELFTVWALWSLRKLLLLYARSEVFSPRALKLLNDIAVAMFAGVITGFAVQAPITLLLSWPLGPDHRQISLGFGSGDAATLFCAGVVLVIARVMVEARRLADENAKFV